MTATTGTTSPTMSRVLSGPVRKSFGGPMAVWERSHQPRILHPRCDGVVRHARRVEPQRHPEWIAPWAARASQMPRQA